jgi:hypothetical protein
VVLELVALKMAKGRQSSRSQVTKLTPIVFALQLPLLKLSVDHSVVFFCHPGRATKFRASVKAAGTVIGTIPTGTGGKR